MQKIIVVTGASSGFGLMTAKLRDRCTIDQEGMPPVAKELRPLEIRYDFRQFES